MPRSRCLSTLIIAAGSLWLIGCGPLAPSKRAPLTQAERLAEQYSELAEGRFEAIADFEQPEQMELVHVDGSSASSAVHASEGGIPATGGGCLRALVAEPADAIVFDSSRAEQRSLKSDWREFDLLVASVFCPAGSVEMSITLVVGGAMATTAPEARPAAPPARLVTPVLLEKGWNTLRLDLTEAAESAPGGMLDDVQAVRWELPKLAEQIELTIDDVILVSNRKELFGSPSGGAGELYVQRRGRRWSVGAVGRFELGFSQGQIVSWYDLAGDPGRLRNLTGRAALGPVPVVVPDNGVGPLRGLREALGVGETIVARQRLLETSPVRIVVEGEWRFPTAGAADSPDTPYARWVYSIYPSGHVYVTLSYTTPPTSPSSETAPANAIGLAVTTVAVPDDDLFAHSTGELTEENDLPSVSFAAVQPNGENRAGLVFVPAAVRSAPRVEVIQEPGMRQLHLIAAGDDATAPDQTSQCMLSLWPPGNASAEQRVLRALAYADPPPIEIAIGARVEAPGDGGPAPATVGGVFDPGSGYFHVAPDGNRVRLFVDARKRPLDAPVFRVAGVKGRKPAIYVDHVIFDERRTTTDAAGGLIFQIPARFTARHLVEVYLR